MHIRQIEVKNFRLLLDCSLQLEERTTVIVGRNNSGKTSLAELFRRLLTHSSPSFRLEDFSLSAHADLWNAFLLARQDADADMIRSALPAIELGLTIQYGTQASPLGLLSEFIVDLDPDCVEAHIVFRYQLADGQTKAFFDDLAIEASLPEPEQKRLLCRAMRERIPRFYVAAVYAIDPADPTNQKPVEFSTLRALIQSGFINAQRGLDDTTHKDINLLGKILESLLSAANSEGADANDRLIAQNLENALSEIQSGIDGGFNQQLQGILPAFSIFGYPGFNDPGLLTETNLDVKRLLKGHTTVHYAGTNGINLPESYNGLGARNLIFILLKLYEFFKSYKVESSSPGVHLIFIEEPEVHLHPQMQEVFITKLAEIADVFAAQFNNGTPWPVQFVVTTHSSHLANRAPFESMRYFLTTPSPGTTIRSTRIKDLRSGLGGTPPKDRDFLHKYMTLTRCDLLFADKAVLIEGTTERLMLPRIIEKLDVDHPDHLKLSSQYLSVVEVGGAYAHLFLEFLEFLELRTLIITDLDSVKPNATGRLAACKVSQGTRTSNACIKHWFAAPEVSPVALLQKSSDEKTKGRCRLAFQLPEIGATACGRSFEGAFMLANPELFELNTVAPDCRETAAWDRAENVKKKSDFAIEYAITKPDWKIPRYISEGLQWLAQGPPAPAVTPVHPAVVPLRAPTAAPAAAQADNECGPVLAVTAGIENDA